MTQTAAAGTPATAFDYELPAHRIAQQPLEQRDASRLLHLAPDGVISDERFVDLPRLLRPGDVCVVNDTRVRAARLNGRRDDGGPAELLVLRRLQAGSYLCLARPSRHLEPGATVCVGGTLRASVTARAADHPAARIVTFSAAAGDVESAIAALGSPPVPPYIHEPFDDVERYQTVYARGPASSAAAPTAGLHFTPPVIEALRQRGIDWTSVRLDVGLATFAPIRSADIERHRIHAETFAVSESAAGAIESARRRGGRVVAVGTTVVRVLESCGGGGAALSACTGSTDLYIRPGHRFHVVDALLTNFHQPRSSLLVLLAAFAGTDRWKRAYAHALAHGYRFLSFGDCMLCWRTQS